MKNLRTALRDGRTVLGTWCNSTSPVLAELLAGAGFDFVCIDVEHSAVDLPQCQALFQAITAGNPDCAPVVRVHGVDYPFVKRYLDAGARGVICPFINTRSEAETLVHAVKYPPAGRRGVGYCRANDYGRRVTETFATANDELLTVVQIEHIDAIRNLPDLLAVPGIDAAFIGPYDLTASMGIPARFDHPDYLAALQGFLDTCRAARIAPGIHVVQPDPEELRLRIRQGFRLIAYSVDITMVARTCADGLAAYRTLATASSASTSASASHE